MNKIILIFLFPIWSSYQVNCLERILKIKLLLAYEAFRSEGHEVFYFGFH